MIHRQTSTQRVRQVVDWSAAVWAGLIAGLIFLLLNLILTPIVFGANGWFILRFLASPVLGEGILPPPMSFDAAALVVGLLLHFALSIGFSLLLAFILHRGGLLTGILGGALLGLGLFFINFYTFTLFFPWFFALRSWIMVLTHIIFGAVAGGVYEGLGVAEFVPVEAKEGAA